MVLFRGTAILSVSLIDSNIVGIHFAEMISGKLDSVASCFLPSRDDRNEYDSFFAKVNVPEVRV